MELDDAYAYCRSIIEQHSSTFAHAFQSLPLPDRQAIWAVYAFCRFADDIVDEGNLSTHERILRLKEFAEQLQAAKNGQWETKSPLWVALKDVFSRYQMNWQWFEDMIVGQRLDLEFSQPETFIELERYCYYVAGTVGLMLLPILGVSESEKLHQNVVFLGIAMQLTNILRDVKEDTRRRRIYLPKDLMSVHGVTREHLETGVRTENWRALAHTVGRRAEALYTEGIAVLDAFPLAGRVSVSAAAEMYRAILRQIQQSDYDVFGERHYVDAETRSRLFAKISAMVAAAGEIGSPAVFRHIAE